MKYIIDGYNVIHQIAALGGKRLRAQREGLIRLLEMAQAKVKGLKSITVVFDGQTDVFAPGVRSTIKVIFSKGASADRKIKEIVKSSNFARDIGVVSDDREIKSCVAGQGAKKISVKQFLKVVYSSYVENKNHSFKLDEIKVRKINQELEKIWLKNKGEGSEREN